MNATENNETQGAGGLEYQIATLGGQTQGSLVSLSERGAHLSCGCYAQIIGGKIRKVWKCDSHTASRLTAKELRKHIASEIKDQS